MKEKERSWKYVYTKSKVSKMFVLKERKNEMKF